MGSNILKTRSSRVEHEVRRGSLFAVCPLVPFLLFPFFSLSPLLLLSPSLPVVLSRSLPCVHSSANLY